MADNQQPSLNPMQRRTDKGILCWMAMRAAEFWDFVDRRDIDKHAVSIIILTGTIKVTEWAMSFASAHPDKSGIEVAAIIAAVLVPYNALQAAAIQFYFKSRQ